MSEEYSDLNRSVADNLGKVETTLCLSKRVIVITEDRLELLIQDGIQKLSAKDSWIAPLGIFATCLIALVTADFKNLLFVSGGTLKGLFVAATVGSLGWLARTLFRLKSFGRTEFMASIRSAGSPYNYAASQDKVEISSEVGSLSLNGNVVPKLLLALQCRQCGTLIPGAEGQLRVCPSCGTAN